MGVNRGRGGNYIPHGPHSAMHTSAQSPHQVQLCLLLCTAYSRLSSTRAECEEAVALCQHCKMYLSTLHSVFVHITKCIRYYKMGTVQLCGGCDPLAPDSTLPPLLGNNSRKTPRKLPSDTATHYTCAAYTQLS